jgi:hypothetical protein
MRNRFKLVLAIVTLTFSISTAGAATASHTASAAAKLTPAATQAGTDVWVHFLPTFEPRPGG